MKYLKYEKLIEPKLPDLPKSNSTHEKWLWEYFMGALMKTERSKMEIYAICSLFWCHNVTLVPRTNYRTTSSHQETSDAGGTKNLHTRHNKAMTHINLMNLHQDVSKTFKTSGTSIWLWKSMWWARATLWQVPKWQKGCIQGKRLTSSTDAQRKRAIDKIDAEHHAILFSYMTERQRHSKLIEQMENEMLQRMDLFTQSVADACSWKNHIGSRCEIMVWHLLLPTNNMIKAIKKILHATTQEERTLFKSLRQRRSYEYVKTRKGLVYCYWMTTGMTAILMNTKDMKT